MAETLPDPPAQDLPLPEAAGLADSLAESQFTEQQRLAAYRLGRLVGLWSLYVVRLRRVILIPLVVVAYFAVEFVRGKIEFSTLVPYLVAVVTIFLVRVHSRMMMVDLKLWEPIFDAPRGFEEAYRAAIGVALNAIRTVLCFIVPWPTLLPVLVGTFAVSPVAQMLLFGGAFGPTMAHADYPDLTAYSDSELWTNRARVCVICFVWVAVVAVLTAAAWYFVAR